MQLLSERCARCKVLSPATLTTRARAMESKHANRLPALAAELVSLPVAAIVALPSSPAALAAKAAAAKIPIIFALGLDPVELGLVASYNLPGGNVTGVS